MTPEARAKAIAELDALEKNPPVFKLSPEEIAELENEKRALKEAIAPVRSDAGRISGEGSAVAETGPVRAPARFDPPWQEAGTAPNALRPLRDPRVLHPRFARQAEQLPLGDADPEVLSRLLVAAKRARKQADEYRAFADEAEDEAVETRAALDSYMTEHGLR